MENTIYTQPDNVILRDVGDETLLLNIDTEQYFGLNSVGTEMYRRLVSGETLASTLEALASIYSVSMEVLEEDCAELVGNLLNNQLIAVREA